MHDAAPGRHPLDAAGAEQPRVALVVGVAHAAGEHVGHRFEAAVRMIREAGDVVARVVGSELIEQQKRIERVEKLRADDARHADTGTVARRLSANLARDLSHLGARISARDRHGHSLIIAKLLRGRHDGPRQGIA
jgi:hypothetical protein